MPSGSMRWQGCTRVSREVAGGGEHIAEQESRWKVGGKYEDEGRDPLQQLHTEAGDRIRHQRTGSAGLTHTYLCCRVAVSLMEGISTLACSTSGKTSVCLCASALGVFDTCR